MDSSCKLKGGCFHGFPLFKMLAEHQWAVGRAESVLSAFVVASSWKALLCYIFTMLSKTLKCSCWTDCSESFSLLLLFVSLCLVLPHEVCFLESDRFPGLKEFPFFWEWIHLSESLCWQVMSSSCCISVGVLWVFTELLEDYMDTITNMKRRNPVLEKKQQIACCYFVLENRRRMACIYFALPW